MTKYKFSVDFAHDGHVYKNLSYIVHKFGVPHKMIEIGTYEGRTSFWLSDLVIDAGHAIEIYVIDPHERSDDLSDISFNTIKNNFLYNLSAHKGKVNYINKYSTDGLLELINSDIKVNLVYIDGDHRASQVMTDLVLAWQLLTVGGLILCDDYNGWKFKDNNGCEAAQMSPKMAIDSFIQCNWDKIQIIKIPDSSQIAFVKTKL